MGQRLSTEIRLGRKGAKRAHDGLRSVCSACNTAVLTSKEKSCVFNFYCMSNTLLLHVLLAVTILNALQIVA